MSCPIFWKTSNEDIAVLYDKAVKAEKSVIATSAGGRPVLALAYGKSNQNLPRNANWSSALGSMDPKCYSDPDTKTPTLVLIGTDADFSS